MKIKPIHYYLITHNNHESLTLLLNILFLLPTQRMRDGPQRYRVRAT